MHGPTDKLLSFGRAVNQIGLAIVLNIFQLSFVFRQLSSILSAWD
jgi:hypothetical protein